jgi:hypothetical protein
MLPVGRRGTRIVVHAAAISAAQQLNTFIYIWTKEFAMWCIVHEDIEDEDFAPVA